MVDYIKKLKAFSMVEITMLLLIASLMMAASMPMISRVHVKRVTAGSHGAYACFYGDDGNLHQQLYSGKTLSSDNIVTSCKFTPPRNVSFYFIELVGAGAGGNGLNLDYYDEDAYGRLDNVDVAKRYPVSSTGTAFSTSELRNDTSVAVTKSYSYPTLDELVSLTNLSTSTIAELWVGAVGVQYLSLGVHAGSSGKGSDYSYTKPTTGYQCVWSDENANWQVHPSFTTKEACLSAGGAGAGYDYVYWINTPFITKTAGLYGDTPPCANVTSSDQIEITPSLKFSYTIGANYSAYEKDLCNENRTDKCENGQVGGNSTLVANGYKLWNSGGVASVNISREATAPKGGCNGLNVKNSSTGSCGTRTSAYTYGSCVTNNVPIVQYVKKSDYKTMFYNSGGAAGSYKSLFLRELSSPVPITISKGGTAGITVGSVSEDDATGESGGDTVFGTIATATGGTHAQYYNFGEYKQSLTDNPATDAAALGYSYDSATSSYYAIPRADIMTDYVNSKASYFSLKKSFMASLSQSTDLDTLLGNLDKFGKGGSGGYRRINCLYGNLDEYFKATNTKYIRQSVAADHCSDSGDTWIEATDGGSGLVLITW